MKKDLLILLIFALCASLAMALPRRPLLSVVFAGLLSVGILSHELIVFFGLPILSFMLALAGNGDPAGDRAPRFRPGPVVAGLLVPVGCAVAVLLNSGTLQQGKRIALSWKGTIPFTGTYLPAEGPGGAISFIGRSSQDLVGENMRFLTALTLGVPGWIYIVGMAMAGVFLLACVLGERDRQRAWFFVVVASFQFLCMGPIFSMAMDVGRWVILCLLSAMIVTLESSPRLRTTLLAWVPPPAWLGQAAIPAWVAPLGLAFWGLPIIFYKLIHLFNTSPVGGGLQAYHYLRLAGLPGPRELLAGLGL